MTATTESDMEAMIAELEAGLATAPPEMRPILEQQIANCRGLLGMLANARPAMEESKRHRVELGEAARAFFAPAPVAQIPAWLPDTLTRSEVTNEMLLCPAGAEIYAFDDSVGCAVPQGIGRIPIRQGLTLSFYQSTGRLSAQRFYEQGLLRWDVDYHPSGGRAAIGVYCDTERMQYAAQGIVTRFAPNGTIVSQTDHLDGVRHGWTKLWEDDGYPIVATRYEHGTEVETVLPNDARWNS